MTIPLAAGAANVNLKAQVYKNGVAVADSYVSDGYIRTLAAKPNRQFT